ncbi:MAG TPA: response regulator [Candidatus Nitrosocosmicus sp.]|nr:response regulator [Candidatus Nitrosocosmicus sp.]
MTTYTQEFKDYSLDLVEKSLKLLDYLQEPAIRKKLLENIQNLFSASKMEGQLDIVIYSEYLLNFCNALVKGGVVTNSKVTKVITQCLFELESKIKNHDYILNSEVINELRTILKNSYREERDFIILKNLRALLIDKDSFSHYNIKKNSGKHIQFETVPTLDEAFQKLQETTFDLILCDFTIEGIAQLFAKYAKSIPIVVMSTSDNTRDAQLATKMGAMDYIIKNDDGMKLIQRTLHTSAVEWNKKRKEKKLLLNQQSRKILKYMLTNSSVINERYDSNITLTDSDGKKFKNMIKDFETSDKTTVDNLEKLVSSNYLSKHPNGLTIACPKCQSVNINSRYICQNCGASDFVKGEVMEHNKCGYSDLSMIFEDKGLDKLVCPKCNKELRLIGVDYFRLESAFKCRKCTIIFSNPFQTFNCNDCDQMNIKYTDLGWKNTYTYSLSASKMSEIKQQVISLDDVEKYFAGFGFKVNTDYIIHSSYQTLGPFDIMAQKNDVTIIVSSLGDDIEDNVSKLFELNMLDKVISGRVHKVVLLFSEPKEVTKNLMENYNIYAIVIDDISKLYETFKSQFSKIFSPSAL